MNNRTGDQSNRLTQLEWQAFLYACDELDSADRLSFQQLLQDDSDAQLALIRAVEIIQITGGMYDESYGSNSSNSNHISNGTVSGEPLSNMFFPEPVGDENPVASPVASRRAANRWGLFSVVACILVLVATGSIYLSAWFGSNDTDVVDARKFNPESRNPSTNSRPDKSSRPDPSTQPDKSTEDRMQDDFVVDETMMDDESLDQVANIWDRSFVEEDFHEPWGDVSLDDLDSAEYEPMHAEGDMVAEDWIRSAWNEMMLQQGDRDFFEDLM
jgi:hypothetical protein